MTLTNDEKFALLQDMKVIDNNRKIVERLKKYYEGAKRNDYDIDKQLCIIFQEILGEEKLKFSFKWDETYYGGAKNE